MAEFTENSMFGAEEIYRVPTLDYVSFVKLSYESLVKHWNRYVTHFREDYHFPESFLNDVRQNCYVSPVDVFLMVFLAVIWTLLRAEFTSKVCLHFWGTGFDLHHRNDVIYGLPHFGVPPFAEKLQLSAANSAKVPESVWKLIFYSCTLSWSVYVMLYSGRYQTFWDPLSIWDGWTPSVSIPWDIYVTYLVQSSFYLHSIFGTLYMDVWRKDSAVMIAHHILTLSLIGFSYSNNHFMEGALVLLLHDVTDVELEFTKLNTYLKKRGGKSYAVHEILANFGFACFAISWFLFRLYWYPLKVLYVGLYGSVNMAPYDIPFIPVFSTMLWLLLAMNIWWFHFILIVLYKVATGQMEEIDDTREFEEQKRLAAEKRAKKAKGQLKGGTTPPYTSDEAKNGYLGHCHKDSGYQSEQNGYISTEDHLSNKKLD